MRNTNNNDYYKNLKVYKLCSEYEYIPASLPPVKRIVVFGDIHGDFHLFKALLIFSKVAKFDSNNKPTWIGGDTFVVQVGDQIDRARPLNGSNITVDDENSDVKIMELCNDLHKQAVKYNGGFISLLGNHEIMNVLGIMNYVSDKGISEFKNEELDSSDPNYSGLNARIHAFKPGNKIARMMGCSRMASVIIGSNLFVHGGIIDNMINKLGFRNRSSLEAFNMLIKKWLLGLIKTEEINKYIADDSPFWVRILGKIPPNRDYNDELCYKNLSKTMNILQIDNIIIGHTPQNFESAEKINSTCSSKVWRVDMGLSKAFEPIHQHYGKQRPPIQYLEILNDNEFYVRTFMDQV